MNDENFDRILLVFLLSRSLKLTNLFSLPLFHCFYRFPPPERLFDCISSIAHVFLLFHMILVCIRVT